MTARIINVALDADELDAVVYEMSHNHGPGDFEAECPGCSAYLKLKTALETPPGVAAPDSKTHEIEPASAPAPQARHAQYVTVPIASGNTQPLYAVSAPDRELMEKAARLCGWISESPHERGSINGMAAQLGYALRARLQEINHG